MPMTYRGQVKNGVVVLEGSASLPEGTQVQVQPVEPSVSDARPDETLLEFLVRIGPGTRTREDIDRQVKEERDSWGD
ncbi:MAG: hypothetical protein QOF78_2242 [Phycisphaerales bacterium]|nr:hypothetical protein [Phycisphaerales bacterium]